jgi:hypothetical protein
MCVREMHTMTSSKHESTTTNSGVIRENETTKLCEIFTTYRNKFTEVRQSRMEKEKSLKIHSHNDGNCKSLACFHFDGKNIILRLHSL